MKYVVILILGSLFLASSCQKKSNTDNPGPPPENVLDYMPLAVGNYWVYQHSTCDSGEVDCIEKSIDTNLIVKDTFINGHTYYKYTGRLTGGKTVLFLRDSGNYIVNQYGGIFFTNKDTTPMNYRSESLGGDDTLYYWYYQLAAGSLEVEVPSGIYDCLDMRGHFFRQQDNFDIDHNTHNLYSKNVGLVKKTGVFASSLGVLKQELIGYHIEPSGITP